MLLCPLCSDYRASSSSPSPLSLPPPPPSPSLPPPPSPSLIQCARAGARCDYGLFVGASDDNSAHLHLLALQTLALKMYLNTTFSTLQLSSMETWMKVQHSSRECRGFESHQKKIILLCLIMYNTLMLLSCSTLPSGHQVVRCVFTLRERQWQLFCC